MRKALFAAAAIVALASASATAQNTTTDNPSNGAATGKDEFGCETEFDGGKSNPERCGAHSRASDGDASRTRSRAELHPGAERGHVEFERRRPRHLQLSE